MKYYIATSLDRHADQNRVRDLLQAVGHEITYDWSVHGSVQGEGFKKLREIAINEKNGVERSDFVVVLLPGGRGTHTELGMALGFHSARHDPLLVRNIGTKPKIFLHMSEEYWQSMEKDNEHWCAFYADPFAQIVVGDFADLTAAINAWEKGIKAPMPLEAEAV